MKLTSRWYSPRLNTEVLVARWGHFGQPVLLFPTAGGDAEECERFLMIKVLMPLIEAGRIKLYCVDSADARTWSDRWLSLEERARRHLAYEAWVTGPVLDLIRADSPDAPAPVLTGCSMGAYHAALLTLRRADAFPVAICLSGSYDPTAWHAWGDAGDAAYACNPTWFVPDLYGDHLDWLRGRAGIVLTVGRGAWETHPTRALPSSRHFAGLLWDKGIPCELDEWGDDVSHDWWWWERQIAHHLPRFC